MRILVVSDTHEDESALRRALLAQPTAEVVIHLGDGERETERVMRNFPEKMFLRVKGNCDLASSLPVSGEFETEGVKLFFTHGDQYGVKMGLDRLLSAAEERGARVALYGHTHKALTDYRNGIYIMNPGSLGKGYPPSYGTVDITPQGIVTNIIVMK